MQLPLEQQQYIGPWGRVTAGLLAAVLAGVVSPAQAAGMPVPPLPPVLYDTGPYDASPAAGLIAYSPQYPLWSDGTAKRRWLLLPAGTAIDAARPDAWEFPAGTRAWKEFSFDRPVETRTIERLPDGSWRYAAYVWNAQGTQARLAPAEGLSLEGVPGAPGGRYLVPSRADCIACHEATSVPLLGFSALQLSPDRDPLAPHAADPAAGEATLPALAASGRLRNLPERLLQDPPRIAAASPSERAALGYLHGNCGHCHNAQGPLSSLGLVLARSAIRTDGAATELPGPLLLQRLRSRNPYTRMPPVGVQVSDHAAIALIERWLDRTGIDYQETLK